MESSLKENQNDLVQTSQISQTQFTQDDTDLNISTIISSTIYGINPKPHKNSLSKLHNKAKNIIVLDPYKKTSYLLFHEWQYKIYYEAKESMVVRSQSDFVWLREKLIKHYPGLYVPPLPTSYLTSGESESMLFTLTNFMNAVFEITIFSKSKLLEDFICLPESEFRKAQEKYSQSREMYTINESTIHLFQKALPNHTKTNEIDSLVSKLSNDIQNKALAFGKLISTFHKISKEMNVLQSLFKELADNYEKLSECVVDNRNFSKHFVNCKNVFEEWSIGYSNQHKFFQEEFEHFYTYMEKELKEYKTKIDNFLLTVSEFEKSKTTKSLDNEAEQFKNNYNFHSIFIINEYKALELRQLERFMNQQNEWKKSKNDFHKDYKRFINLIS